MGYILGLVKDLIFLAKIGGVASQVGVKIEFVEDKEKLFGKVRKNRPSLIILDLSLDDPLSVISEIKNSSFSEIPIIGFLEHKEVELKEKAIQAGCDIALSRSVFTQRLPILLEGYGKY